MSPQNPEPLSRPSFSRRDLLHLLALSPIVAACGRRPELAGIGEEPAGPDLPNILILVFDTLSALQMSTHGYGRETTPHLSRFAETATVFHRHYSAGNFTTPGTASTLSGLYPWTHGGMHLYGIVDRQARDHNLFGFLHDTHHTFAYTHNSLAVLLLHQWLATIDALTPMRALGISDELLAERWFKADFNHAFWGERIVRGLNQPTKSSLLFALWDEIHRVRSWRRLFGDHSATYPRGIPNNYYGLYFTLKTAIDWTLEQARLSPTPFFGYVHYWPPHQPYTPHRSFVGMFDGPDPAARKPESPFSESVTAEDLARLRREYDEYVANVDAEFGRLYDRMAEEGLLSNTYLVVTSDHGQLFERGIHGHLTPVLYEPLLRIPLLVQIPGQTERVDVHEPTSQVDLVPSLLHLMGKSVPPTCAGRLLPGLGGSPDPNRPIFAVEAKENSRRGPLRKATLAVIQNQQKLLHYRGYPEVEEGYERFDLEVDPGERNDLYTDSDALSRALKQTLLDTLASVERRRG